MGPQDLNLQIIHQSAAHKYMHATKHSEHLNYLNTENPKSHLSPNQSTITPIQNGNHIPYRQPQKRLPPPLPIIPANFIPTYTLSISYPSKSPSNGSLVRVSDVKEQPSVTFTSTSNATSSSSFTLLLIDPDAPTPSDPKFAYWRHWVVTNIPSSTGSQPADVKDGKTVTAYLAPGPKDESGPHRYLFLLFSEPAGFSTTSEDVGGEEFVERRSFGAREFVERHGLELVGAQWMRGVGDGWNGERDGL